MNNITLNFFELYKSGVDLFGSEENFMQWMNTKHFLLGESPIEYIEHYPEENVKIIIQEINNIAWGNLA